MSNIENVASHGQPLAAGVSASASALVGAATRLHMTERLTGAEALFEAALAEVELEAARLRALVATERARLARLARGRR